MTPDRLPPEDWMALPAVRAVIGALEAEGRAGAARFVGGCVRDALLGRIAPGGVGLDVDVATPLEPPRVVRALERAGVRAVPTGIAHGTVTAVWGGRPVEVTTLRRDVETDGRRAVVAFSTDWGEDAARRDFRLNALYAEPDGRLHDPTGAGVADALAGRIVFVGEADLRLREDRLRLLRFFRFNAWYGRGAPDAEGLAACARQAAGVEALSGERVAKELLRLLAAPDPRAAVADMARVGVLARLAPGLPGDAAGLARFAALVAVEAALGEAADAGLRLAALLPDDAATARAAAARLRLPNALRDRLAACASAGAALDPAAGEGDRRRAVRALGALRVADRARLAWAADPAAAAGWRAWLETARGWTPPAFPLDGAAVKAAGVPEGPRVGAVLRELEAWWTARDFTPGRDDLLAELALRLEG